MPGFVRNIELQIRQGLDARVDAMATRYNKKEKGKQNEITLQEKEARYRIGWDKQVSISTEDMIARAPYAKCGLPERSA